MLEEDNDTDLDEDTLRPEYVLIKPPVQLSRDVIQCHKSYGLAVVDTYGMDIDREANFWSIEEMLQSLFPALFEWFEDLPKVEANLDDNLEHPEHLPQWLLCTKLPGRSSGVSVAAGVAFPTGSDIDFNVQTKCSGFRENILILSKSFISPCYLFLLRNYSNILLSYSYPRSNRIAQYVAKAHGQEAGSVYDAR